VLNGAIGRRPTNLPKKAENQEEDSGLEYCMELGLLL